MMRRPLSKRRNKHIQRTLVEAAKLAQKQRYELAVIYDRERQKGNGNRETLAVARKMVAYLLAVDRQQRDLHLLKNAGLRQHKYCRNKQDEQIAQTARSCMLPTERRRSSSRGSLRIVSGLAENTNSIFCDGSSEPETANGCLVLPSAGTDAGRHRQRFSRRYTRTLFETRLGRPLRPRSACPNSLRSTAWGAWAHIGQSRLPLVAGSS